MTDDPALIFEDPSRASGPATHVFLVGVGRYDFGHGKGNSLVAGGLAQITSPPETIRALADWFLTEFENPSCPLGSLSMCVSEETPKPYAPPVAARPSDAAAAVTPPAADLDSVKEGAKCWAERLESHADNIAVFYFCGHGVSLGQKAALLLSDFGDPARAYEGAIEFDKFRGTMKNAMVDRQLFLLDCCRTNADSLYRNEPDIGSRILSIPPGGRPAGSPVLQCVLLPTIEGDVAFGQPKKPSVFGVSFLDAVRFAAADDQTGPWLVTTSLILHAVDRLIQHRLPAPMRRKARPTALEATNFEFNYVAAPVHTRSFVTIDDPAVWPSAEVTCIDTAGAQVTQQAANASDAGCCVFELPQGTWTFTARLANEPPNVAPQARTLRGPVAYVRLGLVP